MSSIGKGAQSLAEGFCPFVLALRKGHYTQSPIDQSFSLSQYHQDFFLPQVLFKQILIGSTLLENYWFTQVFTDTKPRIDNGKIILLVFNLSFSLLTDCIINQIRVRLNLGCNTLWSSLVYICEMYAYAPMYYPDHIDQTHSNNFLSLQLQSFKTSRF